MACDPELPACSSSKWVGYELHDGLLQWLVGARMSLEATLDPGIESIPREVADDVFQSLVAAIDEGRMLIAFLEEHCDAGKIDLHSAIKASIAQMVQCDRGGAPHVGMDFHLQVVELPQAVGWNILRIVQQAVLNAMVHAEATSIFVCTVCEESSLEVTVKDDGGGFDVSQEEVMPGHFGINSMRHRAKMLDANLEIVSRPGKGTLVRLVMPNILPPLP